MPTYLLVFKEESKSKTGEPAWAEYYGAASKTMKGEHDRHESWSVGKRKDIQPGDRLFLLKLGKEPAGIVAAGYAESGCSEAPSWRKDGSLVQRCALRWEQILRVDKFDPFRPKRFAETEPGFAAVHWTPQSPGTRVPDAVASRLEELWRLHVAKQCGDTPFAVSPTPMG